MSRGQRVGLVVLALVVAVVAFAALRPGDEPATPRTTNSNDNTDTREGTTTPTDERRPPPKPDAPLLAPGEATTITVRKGDEVLLRARSKTADEVHVHGYDILKAVPANRTIRLAFPATIEGIFEIELEESQTVIGMLRVEP